MITPVKEYKLNIPLGISLTQDKILLATSSEMAQKRIEPYLEFIRTRLQAEGKTLVYLPEIISSITPEIAAYAFPGVNLSDSAFSLVNDRVFSCLQPNKDEVRLVRSFGKDIKFFILDLENVEHSVFEYVQSLWFAQSTEPRFRILPSKYEESDDYGSFSEIMSQTVREDTVILDDLPFPSEPSAPEEDKSVVDRKLKSHRARKKGNLITQILKKTEQSMFDLYMDDDKTGPEVDDIMPVEDKVEPEKVVELPLEDKTRKIIADLEAIKRKYGISDHDLEQLIGRPVELSDLHITRSGRIYLPAYNNRELDLDTKTRALYILFIKHPEGIGYKYLADYRKELLNIYSSITNRDDLDQIISTIDSLVDPFNSNNVSISVARIKKAFTDIVSYSRLTT